MRPTRRHWSLALSAPALFTTASLCAQQRADSTFHPTVPNPAYGAAGPRVAIDEAHANFHTMGARYKPFADLLGLDGYRVGSNTAPFTAASLHDWDILIVANALGGEASGAFDASAFTPAEVEAVREWVRGGGSLLLVADHAPFGSAAENLSLAFGVGMGKGFTLDTARANSAGNPTFLRFSRANGLLGDHAIMRGRDPSERIDTVQTFTGQSLTVPAGAAALLALSGTAMDRAPPTRAQAAARAERANRLRDSILAARAAGDTARDSVIVLRAPAGAPVPAELTPAAGRAQGVALAFGRGRVVVLGEAALLTAQVVDIPGVPFTRMGMNVPGSDDEHFALNVMHWLSRLIN